MDIMNKKYAVISFYALVLAAVSYYYNALTSEDAVL